MAVKILLTTTLRVKHVHTSSFSLTPLNITLRVIYVHTLSFGPLTLRVMHTYFPS